MRREPVVVVGGGNSAGQAAMFLASKGSPVCVVVRRALTETMSRYLVDRIEAHPNVQVRVGAAVTELHGEPTLQRVTITESGATLESDCSALFSFIGAEPNSGWLGDVAVDEHGFVLTDRALDAGLGDGGRNADARHSPTRRVGRACSRWATYEPDRRSDAPPRSGKDRRRSGRSTSTCRSCRLPSEAEDESAGRAEALDPDGLGLDPGIHEQLRRRLGEAGRAADVERGVAAGESRDIR